MSECYKLIYFIFLITFSGASNPIFYTFDVILFNNVIIKLIRLQFCLLNYFTDLGIQSYLLFFYNFFLSK